MLDEPTSGLDSHIALKVFEMLQNLVEEGKLIISVLHQPSSLIFHKMHRLLILNHGQTVFLGRAAEVVPYMSSLKIDVNYRMNPSDFFMLEICKAATPMTSSSYLESSYSCDQQHE